MNKLISKIANLILYLSISFISFSLMMYILAFVFGLYTKMMNLSSFFQFFQIISLFVINLVLWFFIFKKFKSILFKFILIFTIVLFALFFLLFRPYKIVGANVGRYERSDMVYAIKSNFYPYKNISIGSVVVFEDSVDRSYNIGVVESAQNEHYVINFSGKKIIVGKENILAIVVGRYYRDN